MTEQSIELYMTEGVHNKVYKVWLRQANPKHLGWKVDFAYGRIGTKLLHGTKTEPVSFAEARATYEKLVQSKKDKGYKESGNVASTSVPLTKTKQAVTVVNVPVIQPVPSGRKYK